jgi:hypothetical protein
MAITSLPSKCLSPSIAASQKCDVEIHLSEKIKAMYVTLRANCHSMLPGSHGNEILVLVIFHSSLIRPMSEDKATTSSLIRL